MKENDQMAPKGMAWRVTDTDGKPLYFRFKRHAQMYASNTGWFVTLVEIAHERERYGIDIDSCLM